MAEKETFERIRNIIVDQLGVDPADVTMEAHFRDDLEADSLDLVELIMAFEEEFGGEISDDEAQKIVTVGDAVRFLDARARPFCEDEPVSQARPLAFGAGAGRASPEKITMPASTDAGICLSASIGLRDGAG